MNGTLNKVMLIGHTGDEVKMHYFEGGGCVGRFPVATNDSYTNKSTGERIENTEWHNVVMRNKMAEACEKYLKKGDKIYIEGRIKNRKWQDDSGNDRYSTEIQATDFNFLSPKQQGQPQAAQGNDAAVKPAAAKTQQVAEPESDNDDLPF